MFKKKRLLPEETLRFYIKAAFRLKQFVMSEGKEPRNFSDYSKKYWRLFPKDRIMQLYAQFAIQDLCEESTSIRVLKKHNRMETESLKSKITKIVDYLIDYAEKRPENYDVAKMKADASSFWQDRDNELKG